MTKRENNILRTRSVFTTPSSCDFTPEKTKETTGSDCQGDSEVGVNNFFYVIVVPDVNTVKKKTV